MSNAALQKDRSEFAISHLEQLEFDPGSSILSNSLELDQMGSASDQPQPESHVCAPASMEMPIRILLVDEQTIVREGLQLIIKDHPNFEIVGDAGNCEDALDIAIRQQPDIIVLDPELEGDITHKIICDLLAAAKESHIIILTSAKDPDMHREAISLGAKGIVLKQEVSQTLIRAIEKVYAGETWLERSATANLLTEVLSEMLNKKTDPEATKIATLTLREREVIGLIAEGLKTRQIAERLVISQATVSHHLTSIFSKLGVSDRLQLIVYAYHQGLAKSGHWRANHSEAQSRYTRTG